MKKVKMLVILLIVAASVPLVHRGTAEDCSGDMPQLEINQCLMRDYEDADAALNAVYKKLVAAVEKNSDKKAKDLLVKSQRAWIPFRDGECAYVADAMRGGSAYNMLYYGCLADMTRERTTQLRAHLDQWVY